jgi:hypothetical protein
MSMNIDDARALRLLRPQRARRIGQKRCGGAGQKSTSREHAAHSNDDQSSACNGRRTD